MKLMIVDDEALARQRLRQLIERLPTPTVHSVTEAADAEQAWSQLLQAAPDAVPDVLLLDIRMPGPNAHAGLHLARRLREQGELRVVPVVIFVTAHAEHALKAFELEAVDYLTKPVRLERLQAALLRVEARVRPVPPVPPRVPLAPLAQAGEDATLVINERGRVLRLPLSELLYLRAEQKLVLVRSEHESHLVDESLSELELRLQPGQGQFIRVHRNALVALRAIRALELREIWPATGAEDPAASSVESWAVRVAPLDEWLAVSRRQVAAVRAALLSNASAANPSLGAG